MHLLRRQKLQMQAPSLLLETKYSKWRSAQRNSLLNEIEARPGCTPGREGRGCAPVRKKAVKRWLSQLYRSVLRGLCLPSGQLSDFFFPQLTYPETLPWVCTYPSAKMNLEVNSSGRSKPHMTWHYPLTFDPQGAFVCICSVSLSPKRWGAEIP